MLKITLGNCGGLTLLVFLWRDRATRFMEGHCHKATQFVEGQSRSVCEGEKTIRVMEGQSRSVYGGSLKAARFGEF